MTLRVNAPDPLARTYLASAEASRHRRRAGWIVRAAARPSPLRVERLPGFAQGLVSVQDLAAQYAAPLLDLRAGSACWMRVRRQVARLRTSAETADIELTAVDRDAAASCSGCSENTRAAALAGADLVHADAAEPSSLVGRDAVRPHPARCAVHARPASCAAIPTSSGCAARRTLPRWRAQQRRLLGALWHALAAGGKLLYATCSVFPDGKSAADCPHSCSRTRRRGCCRCPTSRRARRSGTSRARFSLTPGTMVSSTPCCKRPDRRVLHWLPRPLLSLAVLFRPARRGPRASTSSPPS